MNCQQFEESLSAYLDDALTVDETEEMKNHMKSCPTCQKAYEDLKQTVTMLSSLEEEIPPAGFRRALYSKLQKEQTAPKKASLYIHLSDRVRKLSRFQLMPVAAVLVIMLITLPLVMDSFSPSIAEKADSDAAQSAGEYNLSAKTRENTKTTSDTVAITGFTAKDGSTKQAPGAPEIENNMETTPAPLSPGVSADIERKIIKNADIAIGVENYDKAVADIKNKVAAVGGYISNESGTSSGAEAIRNGYLQVRVPGLQFEAFLTDMDSLGKVKSRNVYSQDVTEEYVDVESHLKAMRTKEERLLAILSSSGKLSDILAVENELANTRAELESLQGRLRYLNNRTEFSNIGINIEQVAVSVQQISTGGLKGVLIKAKEAFILAVNNIIKDAGKLVVRISSALPYIILLLLVVYGLWLIVRKKKKA